MIKFIRTLLLGLLVFLFVFSGHDAEAKRRQQRKHKGAKREFSRVKSRKIKRGKRKKLRGFGKQNNVPAPEFAPVKGDGNVFIPQKDLSIVSEDTNTIGDGDLEIVEQDEEVLVDSSWIRIASYFSIWDTEYVNPYKKKKLTLDEPVSFVLFDSARGLNTIMPLRRTKLNSRFGARWGRLHAGVDLELDMWDTIRATFDGIVRVVGFHGGGYGNFIVLRHYNGLETVYGHMVQTQAESGQLVKAGDVIGFGGNTGKSSGPHLHYELRYQGLPFNPEDCYDFDNWRLKSADYTLYPGRARNNGASYQTRSTSYIKVQPGQTLGQIARRYRVNINTLRKLNRIKGSSIRAGQRLRIR
jgi:murein DD-endopeptidase MepM/ murein hydrolase activator NlpD